MRVPIGQSGVMFLGRVGEGRNRYYLESRGTQTTTAFFERADLLHLHQHAAPFDRRAETDAIYDGPKFTAKRAAVAPAGIGVKLSWMEDDRRRELFFQGEEWDQFLQALDSICTSGCAS